MKAWILPASLVGVIALFGVQRVWAGADDPARASASAHGLGPLSGVPVPRPSDLGAYVRDEQAAIVLGKALFWDTQLGSDSQACASCHFHAGADVRAKNQLNPGLLRVTDPSRADNPDPNFGDELGLSGSGGDPGPNYTLVAEDFPFHRLEDHDSRQSCVDGTDDDHDGLIDGDDPDCYDTNDVGASQGTFSGGFVSNSRSRADSKQFDVCGEADLSVFAIGHVAARKVEPRNTPTTLNAVFNHRNFWDGRANNVFNGLNPLGERGLLPTAGNPRPGNLVVQPDGTVAKVQVRIDHASLASQAAGPPNSDFEMACEGRTFADIGQKLRNRSPLGLQKVHPQDSVLGSYVKGNRKGLPGTYQRYIERAFQPRWWSANGKYTATGDVQSGPGGYTQMDVNFSLFFSLAIQLYEATLVSSDSPFDRYMAGNDAALDPVQKFGLEVFVNEGKCVSCHAGPELTGASVRLRAARPAGQAEAIERMRMDDGGVALYDGGYYNIGVRPTLEDLGVGVDLAGYPLSFSRQAAAGPSIDSFSYDSEHLEQPGPVVQGERVAVDGAFKTPSLRNVELTGPYFHNGGVSTLADVVAFYNRGGDRIATNGPCDTTGFGDACSNLDADIQSLGLGAITRDIGWTRVTAEDALVQFMVALTDDRVRYERAPFDHPEITLTDGHPGNEQSLTNRGDARAADSYRTLPAVGASGSTQPLGTFLGLDPGAATE